MELDFSNLPSANEETPENPEFPDIARLITDVNKKLDALFRLQTEDPEKKRRGRPRKIQELPEGESYVYDQSGFTSYESELLTREEEQELLRNFVPLREAFNREQEKKNPNPQKLELLRQKKYDVSTKIMDGNIRLVVHMAKKFRRHNIDFGDLITAGVCGMMEALERFELSYNTRIATYATWWIRQQMQIAVARESNGMIASLSPHNVQDRGTIFYFCEEFEAKKGRKPTPEEISAGTGFGTDYIQKLHSAYNPVSLSNPLAENEDDLSDFLSEGGLNNNREKAEENSTDEDVAVHDREKVVSDTMLSLRPRERKILELRYGLNNRQAHSLRQIGKLLRISKERVRQIQIRAEQKLLGRDGEVLRQLLD